MQSASPASGGKAPAASLPRSSPNASASPVTRSSPAEAESFAANVLRIAASPRTHNSPSVRPRDTEEHDGERVPPVSSLRATPVAEAVAPEAPGHAVQEAEQVVRADAGLAVSTIPRAVLTCSLADVKRVASDWSAACGNDIRGALFSATEATLELAGIAGSLRLEDIDGNHDAFLGQLPEWVVQNELDLSKWPLLPNVKPYYVRRIAVHWHKFWLIGLIGQTAVEVLERRLPELLIGWLLPMSRHKIRSVRHASTVASLAVAEALGSHCAALRKSQAMFTRQLAAAGHRNPQQAEQIERELKLVTEQSDEMHRARMEILDSICSERKYDVCEAIRLHTLIETDKLLRQDAALFTEVKWTTRVFLMILDKSAEVRLRTVAIIHSWYENLAKKTEAVQLHLKQFAIRSLKHLVERVGDVDVRVAVAAIRCLGLPEMAQLLQDDEFESVVNMIIGAHSHEVRSEAALFINTNVFRDPGICSNLAPPARRGKRARNSAQPITNAGEDQMHAAEGTAAGDEDQEQQAEPGAGQDAVSDLFKSETTLSMLVDYLENYVGEHLRLAERTVNAFWGKAPCLTHWQTMVNMCMVSEHAQDVGVAPITPKQRLIILYIMEAAVRRADEDWRRTLMTGVQDVTSVALNDACAQIVPELPRLFEACRPEEAHMLLLSHVAKILIEYASDNKDSQSLVKTLNAPALIKELRNAILQETLVDTITNCTDIFLMLSRSFSEVQNHFFEMSNELQKSCTQLVESIVDKAGQMEDLRNSLSKFVTIANRAFDMTYGRTQLFFHFLELLNRRADWVRVADSWDSEVPSGVPDAELAMRLMEAALISLIWYCRLVDLVAVPGSKTDKDARVTEVLQGVDNVDELRSCLPEAASDLRNTLIALIKNSSEHPGVRFVAFSCFFTFCQAAFTFSKKISLEAETESHRQSVGASTLTIQQEHVQTLSEYLESLLLACSLPDTEAILPYDAEGQRVKSRGVQPTPSRGALTCPRLLQCSWIEYFRNGKVKVEPTLDAPNADAKIGTWGADERRLCAALACLMVAESEVEDVYTGPLGHILLMQCERNRPKVLRDIGLRFKKWLRERARATEDHAIHYFRMQKMTILRAFVCGGADTAASLSKEFVMHWGLFGRGPSGTEGSAFMILRESVLSCITADRKLMPLLEAFGHWLKSDEFITEPRRLELIEVIRQKCVEVGLDANNETHITGIMQRMQLKLRSSFEMGDMGPPPVPERKEPRETSPAALDTSMSSQLPSAPEQQEKWCAEAFKQQGAECKDMDMSVPAQIPADTSTSAQASPVPEQPDGRATTPALDDHQASPVPELPDGRTTTPDLDDHQAHREPPTSAQEASHSQSPQGQSGSKRKLSPVEASTPGVAPDASPVEKAPRRS